MDTPELDRLNEVIDEVRTLTEFLEEFLPQQKISLHQWRTGLTDQRSCDGKGGLLGVCRWEAYGEDCGVCGNTGMIEYEVRDRYLPYGGNMQDLIYKYLDLDPNKIEAERRDLLESIR